jgi:biofilm PGA synthesis N-glycosyltransferase PgaC
MEPLTMFDRILALFVLALVLGVPLGLIFLVTGQFLMDFVFFYPLFMSALWIAGGLYFWLHWERHWPWKTTPAPPGRQPADLDHHPLLQRRRKRRRYHSCGAGPGVPEHRSDRRQRRFQGQHRRGARRLALEAPRLRVLHLAQNQGKAVALRMGAMAARSEYLVCIDGDALLDKNAAAYLVAPMLDNPRLGAVTGNRASARARP